MPEACILVVDDDPKILSLLRRGLSMEGYRVLEARDGGEALARVREESPDLVVLDLMLPGVDGLEVCRRIRRASEVPVLMLTARDTLPDKVAGFESGADDYLVKPFAFEELLARARALLRRAQPQQDEVLRFADLELNTATREARRGGQPIDLSVKEFDLLEYFLRHPRQVLTRPQIFAAVWGSDYLGGSNVIDVTVSYLRDKLEASARPRLIQTVRGVGYALREEPGGLKAEVHPPPGGESPLPAG
jgi:two-component system response regulator MprA